MKKLYLLSIFFFLTIYFLGCGLANSKFLLRDFEKDKPKTTNVGSVMMTVLAGYKNDVYQNIRDAFRQELLYGGIDHNVIQVDYREYQVNANGTLIRDAYTQSVKYDLSVSKTIKFRSIEIDVLEANTNEITFVLKNFNVTPEYDGVKQEYSSSF